jgi:hypothetical protein
MMGDMVQEMLQHSSAPGVPGSNGVSEVRVACDLACVMLLVCIRDTCDVTYDATSSHKRPHNPRSTHAHALTYTETHTFHVGT